MKIQKSKETKKTQILSSQILKLSQWENKENKGREFRKEIIQEKFPELIDRNFHLHTSADMEFQKIKNKEEAKTFHTK